VPPSIGPLRGSIRPHARPADNAAWDELTVERAREDLRRLGLLRRMRWLLGDGPAASGEVFQGFELCRHDSCEGLLALQSQSGLAGFKSARAGEALLRSMFR